VFWRVDELVLILVLRTLVFTDNNYDYNDNQLSGRLCGVSADVTQRSFLFQCVSAAIQRFNSVLLSDTFVDDDLDQ